MQLKNSLLIQKIKKVLPEATFDIIFYVLTMLLIYFDYYRYILLLYPFLIAKICHSYAELHFENGILSKYTQGKYYLKKLRYCAIACFISSLILILTSTSIFRAIISYLIDKKFDISNAAFSIVTLTSAYINGYSLGKFVSIPNQTEKTVSLKIIMGISLISMSLPLLNVPKKGFFEIVYLTVPLFGMYAIIDGAKSESQKFIKSGMYTRHLPKLYFLIFAIIVSFIYIKKCSHFRLNSMSVNS